MKKVTVLMLGLSLVAGGMAFAQASPQAQRSSVQATDVGNKACPVSGNPIGVMGPGIVHVHNGKIYHLCCPGCIGRFDSNPEKYSKIAEDNAKIAK